MTNLFRSLFYLFLSLFLILIGIGVFSVFIISKELPMLPKSLEEITLLIPTEIYDDKGEVLFILGGINRVPIGSVSSHFKKAIIATEDKNFYSHHGVDKTALARAALSNLRQEKVVQGASTITQQLTKNLFFSFKKSYKRKLFELLIALQVETAFTKDEILEAYCNQIYFGAGAYGIKDAARVYFGKHADSLTLPEASLLAGLPNSPSLYNPFINMDQAKKRQALVLQRMAANGMITEEEKKQTLEEPLKLADKEGRANQNGYFIQHVIKECTTEFGADAVNFGGLKIYTTLNRRLQSLAWNAVNTYLPELDENLEAEGNEVGKTEAALVAMEAGTGWVKAMVGGRNYSESQYNRAVANNRQPGSGFKPFVYYTALDKSKHLPSSVVVDEPFTVEIKGSAPWSPENYGGNHSGPIILKKALMKSINIVSAKLMVEAGVDSVIQTAKKFGITSALPRHLSIALGACSLSPMEMASAYSVIASGGKFIEPSVILKIIDNRGNVIKESIPNRKQNLDPVKTYMLIDMLKGVFDGGGTAAKAKTLGWTRPSIGKTGTTNESRDAWFTGFTPAFGASVWVGYDDNRPMVKKNHKGLTGGEGALPIWVDFMSKAVEGEPVNDFPIPSGIKFMEVDVATGLPPTEAGGESMRVATDTKEEEFPASSYQPVESKSFP